MPIQYARIVKKSAPLESDFARSFVAKRFGDDVAAMIFAEMPRYSRGPRKGQIKGYVLWDKVEIGGWVRNGARSGVETPGVKNVKIALGRDDDGGLAFAERSHHASNLTDEEWRGRAHQAITLFQQYKPNHWRFR